MTKPGIYKHPPVLLCKENAVGRTKCGHYLFECKAEECKNLVGIAPGRFKKSTGYCHSHSKVDPRPYMSMYKALWDGATAGKRQWEVTVTYEEFLQFVGKTCSYCGQGLMWYKGHELNSKKHNIYNLDRVDPTKGYHKDNLKPCCNQCNRMKFQSTEADFIARCIKIASFYKTKLRQQARELKYQNTPSSQSYGDYIYERNNCVS